jgi:hypothetical protein
MPNEVRPKAINSDVDYTGVIDVQSTWNLRPQIHRGWWDALACGEGRANTRPTLPVNSGPLSNSSLSSD